MHVLFDHQIFTYQEFGGISRYFYELINYYNNSGILEAEVSLILTNNHYLLEDPYYSNKKTFMKNFQLTGKMHGAKIRLMAAVNQSLTERKLREGNFDILHPTFFDTYFLNNTLKKPYVLTIYDLIEEIHNKKKDKAALNKYKLAQGAAKIISISEHTKKDIINLYNISADKIEVVYLGNSLIPNEDAHDIWFPEKYILFIGKRGGYKNFDRFIKAFAELRKDSGEELSVICIGGGQFIPEENELMEKMKIADVVMQYNADDRQLYHYYHNAKFFVFPSLYEGFGIPLLEAFASGCPVLCSNRTSLPEIAKNAALYFDPDVKDSMLNKMKELLKEKSLREDLVQKGFARLKEFSWKRTAEETKVVYENIL